MIHCASMRFVDQDRDLVSFLANLIRRVSEIPPRRVPYREHVNNVAADREEDPIDPRTTSEKEHPNLLAVGPGVRIDRAAMRSLLEGLDLRPDAPNPAEGRCRRLRLFADPECRVTKLTFGPRLEKNLIRHS